MVLCRDVEFGLIGYGGPDGEWPVHFPNNGKITYEGRADKIKFKTSEDPKPSLETWEDKLKFVIRYINTELGKNLSEYIYIVITHLYVFHCFVFECVQVENQLFGPWKKPTFIHSGKDPPKLFS